MYDKAARSLKRRKHLCALLSILGLGLAFIPLRAVTVPLGIVLCFLIYFTLSLLLVARPINKALFYEMDAEKFLYLSYELGYGGSVCDIYADYYRGRYEKAIELINESILKTKRRAFIYEYYTYLAYCYFEMNDMEGLKSVLEKIKLLPCEKRSERALKAETEFLVAFLTEFSLGEYGKCKEMNIIECSVKEFEFVPALKYKLKLYHGIACYKNGDTQDAEALFKDVAQACPNIHFSKIAESYLEEKTEIPKKSESPEGSFFATAGDIKRQNYKAFHSESRKKANRIKIAVTAGIIVILAVILIFICIKFIPLGGGKPSDPYTVIKNNDDITRVVDVVPVNPDGDALCIYLTNGQYMMGGITEEPYYSQTLGIAYLDRVGDNLYKYGVSVKFPQAEKWVDSSLYKISAPDIDKDIYFRIVGVREEIPADALISREFYVNDESYYLCFMYMKDADIDKYSFEKAQNP